MKHYFLFAFFAFNLLILNAQNFKCTITLSKEGKNNVDFKIKDLKGKIIGESKKGVLKLEYNKIENKSIELEVLNQDILFVYESNLYQTVEDIKGEQSFPFRNLDFSKMIKKKAYTFYLRNKERHMGD
jgi:hypothetical protein